MDLSHLNNNNANMFGSASGGLTRRLSDIGGLMHQQLAYQHATALNQQHHDNLMQHAGVVHSNNMELETARHGNASSLSSQEHKQGLQRLEAETYAHGVKTKAEAAAGVTLEDARGRNQRIAEFESSKNRMAESQQSHTHAMEQGGAAHSRSMDFMNALRKHAEQGTNVDVSHGDISASFTLKKKTPRASRAQAAEESETPQAEEKPKSGPSVTRDPKTGRIKPLRK